MNETDLTLREAQRRVDAWIAQYQAGYWPPLANLARLIEETGELARLLNHREGHKPKKAGEAEQEKAEEEDAEDHGRHLQPRSVKKVPRAMATP